LACKWYLKAARSGDARSQNNLGVLYMDGNGVNQDLKKAMFLFQKAAAQGHFKAIANLKKIKKRLDINE